MKRQKKTDSGITLVALVVSIIVMLVLAGVSLNATIGENGIVTRAQEATLQHKIAEDLENLNLELAKINVDTISTDATKTIQDIAGYLVSQGAIDSFVTTSAGQIAAGIDTATGNKYFFGVKGDNTYRIMRSTDGLLSAELTTNSSGGDITGGYSLVTADSFNSDDSLPATEKGKFTITSDAEVVFMDTISGALSIKVNSGVHATVGIYAKMDLTNQGVKRSAIDIEEGGSLDLYIGDGVEVTVNSGLGTSADGSVAGKGGYAGIHVPWTDTNGNGELDDGDSYATLRIFGNGTVKAIGGNAGSGPNNYGTNVITAGGGGAGAGIGGKGGDGGTGRMGDNAKNYQICENGGIGESCGKVIINDTTTVYAYGGAGGSGGTGGAYGGSGSGGGGGYPAAGIGGGGAGGAGSTCCGGGGGFTGGSGSAAKYRAANGLAGDNFARNVSSGVPSPDSHYYREYSGGGYYEGGHNISIDDPEVSTKEICFGGFSANGYYCYGHKPGDGGTGGSGGYVEKASGATIYAFNGNRITDGSIDYGNGLYQAPIYLQAGIKVAKYKYTMSGDQFYIAIDKIQESIPSTAYGKYVNPIYGNDERGIDTYKAKKNININTELSITGNPLSNVNMAIQGVGSGAGFIEVSNGTYIEK